MKNMLLFLLGVSRFLTHQAAEASIKTPAAYFNLFSLTSFQSPAKCVCACVCDAPVMTLSP